jgi:hypothetical protein
MHSSYSHRQVSQSVVTLLAFLCTLLHPKQRLTKKEAVQIKSLVSLLAFVGASAQAVEWHLISTSSDLEKKIYWYVDTTSITTQSNLVQARLRTVWSTMQFGPDRIGYQSTTYLNYVDCKHRSIAFTGNTYFQDAASASEPVHREDELPLSSLKFMTVRPGSSGEVRVNYLCRSSSESSNSLT